MNVRELKEALEDLPDDMEVICQKDSEGNGYSPLSGIDSDAYYVADSTYSGDVYMEEDRNEFGVDEQELIYKTKSLILYPTN